MDSNLVTRAPHASAHHPSTTKRAHSENDPNFPSATQGWVAGFADYPVGQDGFFELEADYRALRAPLNTSQNAQYISGNNHSDDLWMYYKGQVAGLDANRRYAVRFEVEIATTSPTDASASAARPEKV